MTVWVLFLVVALAASMGLIMGSGVKSAQISLRDYTDSELFARSVEYTEQALKARDEYERSNKTYGIQFTSRHLKHYRRLQAEVRRTNRELRRRGAEEYAHQ